MNIDGLGALLNQFHDMKNNIEDDVDDILLDKAKEYVVRAKLKAREVMNKGYWTGNLSRNIRYKKLAICNTLSHHMQLIVVF